MEKETYLREIENPKIKEKLKMIPESYINFDLGRSLKSNLKGSVPDWYWEIVDERNYSKHFLIISERITGGASGGNCWGDEAQYFEGYEDAEIMIDNDTFKKTLGYNIEDFIVHDLFVTEAEYYGNYTDKEIKVIILYDIINRIGRIGKIEKIIKED